METTMMTKQKTSMMTSAEMTVMEIAEIVSGCTKANSGINKYDYLTQIQNYQECMIQISRVLLDYFSTEVGRC